ncbi:MAG TPA: exonuclease domain-containing protein [Streptosporangiaceae bacterium]
MKFWRGVARWRDRLLPRRARQRAAARRPAVFLAGLVSGDRALAETDFVVVDLETTGWTPAEARITEIGAVRVTGGQITGEFSTLINPGQPIPPDIAELTGISDDMVARAPAIETVLPGFLAFAGSGVLTAHNAPFDLGFLIAACADCGLSWPGFSVLDTVTLARQVLGETEVPDCKLATLARYFGAPTSPCHRALADARATVTVLHGLIARLAESGVRTLAELAG